MVDEAHKAQNKQSSGPNTKHCQMKQNGRRLWRKKTRTNNLASLKSLTKIKKKTMAKQTIVKIRKQKIEKNKN